MSRTAEEWADDTWELLYGTPEEIREKLAEAFVGVRNEALEEAAAEVERLGYRSTGVIAYDFIAAAIRNLKKGG